MEESILPGTYYLGDPSFVLNEELYYDVYGQEYNFDSGKFDLTKKEDFIIVHNTHNGDGIFQDTKKRKYKVESGLICLVPIKLINNIEIAKKNGKIFNFPNNVKFIYDAGIFYIKSGNYLIEINTINEDEYESDHEEHLLIDGEKINHRDENDTSSIEDMYDNDDSEDEEEIKNKKPIFFKN